MLKTMKPNDFGKKYLAEQCQKIKIKDYLKKVNNKIKEELIKSELGVDGYNILLNRSRTGFGGTRFWFSCPICNKRVGVLYKHPTSQILGCRTCLRLDYRSHRFKGMIESK